MNMNALTTTIDPIVDPSQHIGNMATADESLQLEVSGAKESLVRLKTKIHLRALNI